MRDKGSEISLHKVWKNCVYELFLEYAWNMQGMHNRKTDEGVERAALFLNGYLFWER